MNENERETLVGLCRLIVDDDPNTCTDSLEQAQSIAKRVLSDLGEWEDD